MSHCSEVQRTYTKSGIARYEIEIWHDELNKYQLIRKDDRYVAKQTALARMAQWDEMWAKKAAVESKREERLLRAYAINEKKEFAIAQTGEAKGILEALDNILSHTLDIDDAIDWDTLKDKSDFPEIKPVKPAPPREPGTPEPKPKDDKYRARLNLFDKLFRSKAEVKRAKAKIQFRNDFVAWHAIKKKREAEYKAALQNFMLAMREWEEGEIEYLKEQEMNNAIIDDKRAKYLSCDPEAILDYCDLVLARSVYPEYFPQSYELDYNSDNKLMVIDYQLPSPQNLPSICEVKYIQSRDEFVEKMISEAQRNKLYDSVLYQVAIRSVHELYEADKIDALESIVFNGFVRSVDPASGNETNGCVRSLQANKEEFALINLASVEPKACFKKLKGVGSSKLHSITPIAPIIRVERDDKRFVASYGVVDNLDDSDNLAAMDWEDFEHLIRELFEKEFAAAGGEVKVTRASRDGGIDAVIFDPDPIRGGKIAVQAKRYTNTVGVAAVRDLYGTVMNEGANKGILVTTSSFGPDAYEFAKGKPLTLLDGGNLLHLLERHGYKAKIDIKEAKRILEDGK